ncbi:hypothetical protein [Kutzneria sp. NPDC051319]|uniref:hypothetical protein n=1 Tax=Kutzneria sp. NPDC051319 TaxID=3155047 RepID=UPI003438F185
MAASRESIPHVQTGAMRKPNRCSPYPLNHADRVLADLATDRVNGAAVLVP